jgi:hypothetical protein
MLSDIFHIMLVSLMKTHQVVIQVIRIRGVLPSHQIDSSHIKTDEFRHSLPCAPSRRWPGAAQQSRHRDGARRCTASAVKKPVKPCRRVRPRQPGVANSQRRRRQGVPVRNISSCEARRGWPRPRERVPADARLLWANDSAPLHERQKLTRPGSHIFRGDGRLAVVSELERLVADLACKGPSGRELVPWSWKQ